MTPSADAPDKNPSRWHGLAACIVVVGLTLGIFHPAILGGKLIAPLDVRDSFIAPWSEHAERERPRNHFTADAVTQYLPYRLFAEESLRGDGYIGWNPYEMGGVSLAGNTMALPASWPMQLHRFLPFKHAWNWGIIAEFLVAAFGMLTFLRSRSLGWLPCLLGAIAFAYNTHFIAWIHHRWALGAFSWMPWVLWAASSLPGTTRSPKRRALVPVFLCLALLGSSLQHMVFVVMACGCFALATIDFRSWSSWRKGILCWLSWGLLAFGIAAFSVVPQVEAYLTNVEIGHARGGLGYEGGFRQLLGNILLIPARIWPWLIGTPGGLDGFKLFKGNLMDLNYLGTIPMLLAFAGMFVKGLPSPAKWLIAVGLLTPLTPLVGPLYHRVEVLFLLGGAWMAAELLASLQSRPVWVGWNRILVGCLVLIGVGLSVAHFLRPVFERMVVDVAVRLGARSHFDFSEEWLVARAEQWVSAWSLFHTPTTWVFVLLAIGVAGLRILRGSPVVGSGLVCVACAAELWTFAGSWISYSDSGRLVDNDVIFEALVSAQGETRVIQKAPTSGFSSTYATPNVLAAHGVLSIDGYESIQPRSMWWVLRNEPDSARLGLAGVGFAVRGTDDSAAPGTEDWPLVEQSGSYVLGKDPVPLALVVAGHGSPPVAVEGLEAAVRAATAVAWDEWSMNRRRIEKPEGSNWLRVSENWHKGWRWRYAGESAWQPVEEGPDGAWWLTSLPKTAGTIEFRFFAVPTTAAVVSTICVLGWMFGTSIYWLRGCRDRPSIID